MPACFSGTQTLAFEAETAWGENVATMTHGLQLCAPVDFSGIGHDMIAPERVLARRLAGSKGIPGPYSNLSISFSCYLTGHGAATTGAVTPNALYTLIGRTIGASAAAASSGTTLGVSAGTATVPLTVASSTISSGAVVRIGALGDADGGGQHYLVSDHPSTSLNLLNDMLSAGVSGGVVYNTAMAYAADSSCALTGTRFRIQSADQQYILHGGFPTSFTITNLGPGEVPKVNFTWQFSWAEPVSSTFPTTPNAEEYSPSPNVADGSYHLQSVGVTTRALVSPRSLSIDYTLSVVPIMGGSGINAYQVITGATRGKDKITCSMTVDAAGASATPTYWDEWLSNPYKTLVATLNSKPTQAVGIVMKNLVYTGRRPSQTNMNGRNGVPLQFESLASALTGNDLTLTPFLVCGS